MFHLSAAHPFASQLVRPRKGNVLAFYFVDVRVLLTFLLIEISGKQTKTPGENPETPPFLPRATVAPARICRGWRGRSGAGSWVRRAAKSPRHRPLAKSARGGEMSPGQGFPPKQQQHGHTSWKGSPPLNTKHQLDGTPRGPQRKAASWMEFSSGFYISCLIPC